MSASELKRTKELEAQNAKLKRMYADLALTDWCRANGVLIQYIQPGKPNQNAYIERFNRTYRNEVLNLYLFRSLQEVREITSRWIDEYNDLRPHDALGGLPPSVYANQKSENSTYELST